MPAYPPDPVVQAEARRLAAEDLDRDLDHVAELLAKQGHHGPDGRPYPARTVANLLDEELRRRRDERWRERIRPAVESFNLWVAEHGHAFIVGGSAEVDAVPTSYCVPADDYPLVGAPSGPDAPAGNPGALAAGRAGWRAPRGQDLAAPGRGAAAG